MKQNPYLLALEMALEPPDFSGPDKTNIGGLAFIKSNGKDAYAVLLASLMLRKGGTLQWPVEDRINGYGAFRTCNRWLAAEIHAEGGDVHTRIEAANTFAADAKSAVATLSKFLLDNYNLVLYQIPGINMGNRIVTITVNPNLVVDEGKGLKAKDIQQNKDISHSKWAVKIAYRRLAAQEGEKKARTRLAKETNAVISKSLAGPKRTALEDLRKVG